MRVSELELQNLLLEVDEKLSQKGVTIPQRPIHAVMEVGKALKLSLPLVEPPQGFHHESVENWYVSKFINDWYEHRYEDKLKMEFSLGLMAVSIRNDIYLIDFPVFYGSITLFASQAKSPEQEGAFSTKGPAAFNIIDSIKDLPKVVRNELTHAEVRELFELFVLGLEVQNEFTAEARTIELVSLAIADSKTAATLLTDNSRQYGLSKWASLQASEKLLKAAIQKSGGTFKNTHNLNTLIEQAKGCGLNLNLEVEAQEIQCSASVRYGEEDVTEGQALKAHHAYFSLAKKIANSIKSSPNK